MFSFVFFALKDKVPEVRESLSRETRRTLDTP